MLRVLQVEDSESDAELVVRCLERAGYQVEPFRVEDSAGLRGALETQTWDVVISDYRLPHLDGPGALAIVHEFPLDIPFIVVSATMGEQLAVAMMKAGAHDYLMKDNLTRLAPAVKREISDAQARRERKRAQESLGAALYAAEERERLLDAIFTAQADGVFVSDAAGTIIRTNPAACALFGFDPTGMPAVDVMKKVQIESPVEATTTYRALRGETAVTVQHTAGGRSLEASAAPIRSETGAVTGAVTICRDITERKAAENALRESEEALRQLSSHALDGILMIDDRGRTIHANPAAQRMFGYTESELLGLPIQQLFGAPQEDVSGAPRLLPAAQPGQNPQVGKVSELTARRKDGIEFPVELSLGGILDGQHRKAVGIVRDMSAARAARRELEEANNRYHALAEQSRTVLWEVDGNGLYTYVSPVSELVWGYRPEELTGRRHFYDLHPEAGRERFKEQAFAAFAQMATFNGLENPIQTKNGHIVWVATHAIPLVGVDGELAGYSGLDRDITERKHYESDRDTMISILRLLNSPNDTRELIRTVTAMLQDWAQCQCVGLRLEAGDDFPYYETRGMPPEFVEGENYLCERDESGHAVIGSHGKPALDCLCGSVLHGVLNGLSHSVTPGGALWTNNLSHLLSDAAEAGIGSLQNRCAQLGFESLALVPLRSSGRTVGLLQFGDRRPDRFTPDRIALMERAAASLAIALEQRRTQSALRSSEERYRLISENTADIVWLMDPQTNRYLYMSPSVESMLGYSPEEMMMQAPDAILAPDSRGPATQRLAELVAAVRSGETPITLAHHVNMLKKDGSSLQVEVLTTVVPARGERPLTILGVTRDISERTQAEAKLMQAQKLESIGRLAGGVAHDFNNLLTVINGYSSMLLRELTPGEPAHDSVSEIATAGERAAALTAQLLLLSRKQVVQPKTVNLNDIISEVEKMLGRVIGEDILLESALSPELGWVRADPGQMHQVLMNLAINARDAMPGGGMLLMETANVTLEAHAELAAGPYVQLKVTDTGVGMTPEVMSHVFEPFYTTKSPGEGTGLGLATVYGVIQQCGGSVSISSELGQGATFEILLPQVERAPDIQEQPSIQSAALRGTETVLVVEDQGQLRKMVEQVLRSHGYRVYAAAGPGEALLHADRLADPIHLLLTDVIMPGMSGRELAEELKRLRPNIKILFMSGYAERAMLNPEILEHRYLGKPFSPVALATKVREILGVPRPTGTILVVDDEPAVRGLLRQILSEAGYHVVEAANGREAVDHVEAAEVDLLITDLAMPEQEGIETIRQLHRLRPELKIVAMSGQFAGPMLNAAKHLGAQASLAKPINRQQLLDMVAGLLRP